MRFDPKLVPAAEAPLGPDGEINLPPDLAALADQLRSDANHLAATYPGSTALPSRFPIYPRSALRSIAAACALILAPLVAALIFWSTTDPKPVPQSLATESSAEEPPQSPALTKISLTDLSGPELEALLDLRPSPDKISVSF